MGVGDNDGSSGDGGDNVYSGRAEPVLDSVLDSYSKDEIILICDSRPFSCPVYTY